MEEFTIKFWKEPFKEENSFVKNSEEAFVTSAQVTKTTLNNSEIFHIKLNDIGLHSLHGEFDIVRKNGFWATSDRDSNYLNFLKWNIIEAISMVNK